MAKTKNPDRIVIWRGTNDYLWWWRRRDGGNNKITAGSTEGYSSVENARKNIEATQGGDYIVSVLS
jgi:hypothetical protein